MPRLPYAAKVCDRMLLMLTVAILFHSFTSHLTSKDKRMSALKIFGRGRSY